MNYRIALTKMTLLLSCSAFVLGHAPDSGTTYVDGWQPSEYTKIKRSGRAIVLRGDTDLCSYAILGKTAEYELKCSWEIENNMRLVMYSSLRAFERGGDNTVLELPETRSVIYTAPSGKYLADAKMFLPDSYVTGRHNASKYGTNSDNTRDRLYMVGDANFGQERFTIDWSGDLQYGYIWGDRWGPDHEALRYELYVRYQVRLADLDMGSLPQSATKPRYKPGHNLKDALRKRP